MSSVLIIGGGDMAARLAHGLGASGRVRSVTFATASHRVDPAVATLRSCYDLSVDVEIVDGRDRLALQSVIRRARPDLVIQSAALMSPWALGGRTDPAGTAFSKAGLGLRLPLQLPILLATMQAVRDSGFAGPVANLSFPDATHPLLHRIGLAPTIGLGNVAMYLLRARAARRAELGADAVMPLIRVVGQHGTVYDVMNAHPHANPAAGPWVWLGDDGERRDDLAYRGDPIPPSVEFNAVTAAASMPIVLALLPDADPLRWSAPGPLGLMGGYPVRIADGAVTLDLPSGVLLDDCRRMCTAAAAGDGIESIDDDMVTYTEAAREAMRFVAPDLAEPFTIGDTERRARRILELLG